MKTSVQTKSIDQRIEDYLKVESLLNKFFNSINYYCYEECITQKVNKYDFINPGYFGCCLKPYYNSHHPAWFDLFKKRAEKYGEPKKDQFCGYHTIDKGCILEDYKPPICLSYICGSLSDHLKEKYNINYNSDHVKAILYNILDGKIDEEKIKIFKSEIQEHIDKVKPVQTVF